MCLENHLLLSASYVLTSPGIYHQVGNSSPDILRHNNPQRVNESTMETSTGNDHPPKYTNPDILRHENNRSKCNESTMENPLGSFHHKMNLKLEPSQPRAYNPSAESSSSSSFNIVPDRHKEKNVRPGGSYSNENVRPGSSYSNQGSSGQGESKHQNKSSKNRNIENPNNMASSEKTQELKRENNELKSKVRNIQNEVDNAKQNLETSERNKKELTDTIASFFNKFDKEQDDTVRQIHELQRSLAKIEKRGLNSIQPSLEELKEQNKKLHDDMKEQCDKMIHEDYDSNQVEEEEENNEEDMEEDFLECPTCERKFYDMDDMDAYLDHTDECEQNKS